MAQSGVRVVTITGLVLAWIYGVTSSCSFLELTRNPPEKALLQNDTHFEEEMYRSAESSFYGCVELCKLTNGCTCLNYESDTTTCVLYSTRGTPTFQTVAGDWLYVKITDTSFPTSPVLCDPTTCQSGQYCRTIQGASACLNFPS